MKKIQEVFQKGTKNMRARKRARDRIEKAKKYLEKLNKHQWVDLFLKPLAEELKPFFPDREYKILGPFGLGCQTTIYFIKKDIDPDSDEIYEGDNSYYLTLSPVDLENGVFEYIVHESKSTFPEGTIGYLNGLGYNRYLIPTNCTVEHFASLFKPFKTKQKDVA